MSVGLVGKGLIPYILSLTYADTNTVTHCTHMLSQIQVIGGGNGIGLNDNGSGNKGA